MKFQRRQIVLAITLVASMAAVAWVRVNETAQDTTYVATIPKRQSPLNAPAVSSPISASPLVMEIKRADVLVSESDPFHAQSWYVAPPAPPPAPPPKPTAPPLPFKYMGMFEDQGKISVYLVNGNESYAVSPGEKISEDYQLEKIERGMLIINYLPLSTRQTLAIGLNE
jgi:hypothetical protein